MATEQDGIFYERLIDEFSFVVANFKRILGILKMKDMTTTSWWSTISQRNNVFLDCANALRSSTGRLLDFIQSCQSMKFLVVHRLSMGDNQSENIYKIIKRSAAEFFITSEEFISDAVAFIQYQKKDIFHFESVHEGAMKHLNLIQAASDVLSADLDKRGIFYTNRSSQKMDNVIPEPIPSNTTNNVSTQVNVPSESPNISSTPSQFDIDNILAEFNTAASNLSESSQISSRNSVVSNYQESTDEYDIPEYTPDSTSSKSNNIDEIASDFESITMNAQNQQRNITNNNQVPARGSPSRRRAGGRGGNRGMRGSPRGSPRGGMRGNPRGTNPTRSRGGPSAGGPRTTQIQSIVSPIPIPESSMEELKKYEKNMKTISEELINILFTTDIEELEGCQIATKFVPTAKSLLTQSTEMENLLKSFGSREVANQLKKVSLSFIHVCKEHFLTQINGRAKRVILKSRDQFLEVLTSVASNKVADTKIDVEIPTPSSPDSSVHSDHTNKPPRSNTVVESSARTTMFAAGAIPRNRTPTFTSGLGTRATFFMGTKDQENTNTSQPAKLTKEQQRERAVEEIFKSEKVFLTTLQRLIWVSIKENILLLKYIDFINIISRCTRNLYKKQKIVLCLIKK